MIIEIIVKNSITPIELIKGADWLTMKPCAFSRDNISDYYADGNLKTVTDANNKTTYYEYYKNNLKKNQKDPLNHITAYTYDATGFMTSLTDPAQAVTAFDKTDLVMTKTDRKGDTINYSYTPDNILEAITYPDSSSVTFTNDELDRTTVMTDSLGTTAYLYDDANRTVTVTDPHGFVVVYRNDEAGRLKELVYPGNKKVIYAYDRLNRMETVKLDWLNQTVTYQYDAAGRLTSLTNFNGTVTTYGYDAANRLTRLENKKSDDSVIASYSFPVLDGIGNRMKVVKKEPFVTVLTPEQSTYTYNDRKNRLLSANSDQQTAFSYDAEGQLATNSNSVIVSLSNYTFDYEYRLTTVAVSGQQSAFSYDGMGNRLKATRDGEITYYIYDMNNNVLAEADSSRNITRLYIHGQGLLAAVTADDQIYSYHYDAIGSTIAMTDQGQNIVNKYAYDSFGKVMNQLETVPQPFKYVGQYGVMAESCELNAECLLYMRARYYDQKVGRFISEDPIGFEGGDVNLMNYVGGNPVNRIDPLGLRALIEINWHKDPAPGKPAATYGPFLKIYGPTVRAQHPLVQEAMKYHERLHAKQWGWGLIDIWDMKILKKSCSRREIEAYTKTKEYVEKLLQGDLDAEAKDALIDFKENLEWYLQHPEDM